MQSTNRLGPDRAAHAVELLKLAERLAKTRPGPGQQACWRRAMSTAYYAIFHLLIGEATGNWSQESDRALLGRLFGHGKMKDACYSIPGADPKQAKQIPSFEKRSSDDHRRAVARAFIESQSQREMADYDLSELVTKAEVDTQVERVGDAFRSWQAIRGGNEAHRFLLELLRPRQERR